MKESKFFKILFFICYLKRMITFVTAFTCFTILNRTIKFSLSRGIV